MSIKQLTTAGNKSFLNLSCRNLDDNEEEFAGDVVVSQAICNSLQINGTLPITIYSETDTIHTFDPNSFVFTTPKFVGTKLILLDNIVSFSINALLGISNGGPLNAISAPAIIPEGYRPLVAGLTFPVVIRNGTGQVALQGLIEIQVTGDVEIYAGINKTDTFRANDLVGIQSFDCVWII